MRFAVIEGSREWTEPSRHDPLSGLVAIRIEDVEAEAHRRLRAIRLNDWRTREFLTGQPMPEDVRHYALQVEYAAKAISRLSTIPQDFDSDIYWPRLWER